MTPHLDKLDRWLRDDARIELPDAGFTARVMGALPPAASRPLPWLKPLLVFGSAALGGVLAVSLAPAGASVVQGFLDLAQLRATPAAITGIAMAAALFLSAIVLAADAD